MISMHFKWHTTFTMMKPRKSKVRVRPFPVVKVLDRRFGLKYNNKLLECCYLGISIF